MPRKSKKQIEQEQQELNNKRRLSWTIFGILIIILLYLIISKTGVLGLVVNNVLVYLFGYLFLVPILSLLFYSIYKTFFEAKHQMQTKTIIGIYVFNALCILACAFIFNEVSNFTELLDSITNGFMSLTSQYTCVAMGGIVGNFVYVCLLSLIDRTGVLIVLLGLFISSLVLIIPISAYKQAYSDIKETFELAKQDRDEAKQEKLLEKQKAEQERKQRLAEKMAMEAELEEAKKSNIDINIEEEKEKKVDTYSTDSPFLINLSDAELASKACSSSNTTKNNDVVVEEENEHSTKILPVRRNNGSYRLPKPIEQFLEANKSTSSNINKTSAAVKGEKVVEILSNFGIESSLINTYIGPSVTKFEIKPDSSVKVNKINNISDNIKMELAARDIRIEAPIPGRNAVGIEIPNVEPIPVKMIDLMKSIPSELKNKDLLFALGKDLMGKGVYCDITKMPHLLIAGATGSGKSVCINSIIISILLRSNPDDVKLVLVDPKKVEFTPYKDIPHLLWPIIDDAQMASNMLKKVVVMMEDRYDAFASMGVRNIEGFNNAVELNNRSHPDNKMNRLPYMVVIIDELADLMMVAGNDVQQSIQRITQLARASGIHLIVATQRPSTDVITGLIKSNIPSRISFAVASSIDSRTILDSTGAERLLGNGDMLYHPQGDNAPTRLQGVYVTDKEISTITKYVKSQAQPQYEDSYYEFLKNMNGTTVMQAGSVNADSMDSLYDDVVEYVRNAKKASTSLLQRRFGIGYNRAARLIDTLEDRGIIGPSNGSKPRDVYLKSDDEDE